MNRDIKSEIQDILNLSRSINTDIQEANRRTIDQNTTLKVNIVNPQTAVETLIKTSGQTISSLHPTSVATYDGQPVEISAPVGLIPMPDGYKIPEQHLSTSVAAPLPNVGSILKGEPEGVQLEFNLEFENPKNRSVIDEIYWKFKRLEDRIDILNSKINELLSIERKKYERRIKKSTEGYNGSQQNTPTS